MGELLGVIPGNKPSGASARVLGLALANFWRRQPRAALDGTLLPTRGEILDRYVPKVATPQDVLNSQASGKNPMRAVEYWHGALQILVENGFLAKQGEAALSREEMKKRLPRKEWQSQWLSERVELYPGPQIRDSVAACAGALPALKPQHLTRAKPKSKRRSRPHKTNTDENPTA